jgi:hypothetical protein
MLKFFSGMIFEGVRVAELVQKLIMGNVTLISISNNDGNILNLWLKKSTEISQDSI